MNVCIVGTGYVGLVTGACLAEMGNTVICVDINAERVDGLRRGELPFFEPGLKEIVETGLRENRLIFTTDLKEGVAASEICFIAVGTPSTADGSADLSAVFTVARQIAESMDEYKVIVTKSTVPVGTSKKVSEIVAESTTQPFSVVSNPEFLKQGDAINDFAKPDRVIIGTSDERALKLMSELYAPFMRTGNRIISMDIPSAELTKYAANAFLAIKISYINEISQLCESVGADVERVRAGISKDPRIGSQFLFPGVGFGGSCLPKDVRALTKTGEQWGRTLPVISGALKTNQQQRENFAHRILERLGSDLAGKTIALWGLSFKPKTDDMREAPSISVVETLHRAGARIQAYDPQANSNAQRILGDKVCLQSSSYTACHQADALVILTEWNEFRRPNFDEILRQLKSPILFDGRNLYKPEIMADKGFEYHSVGRRCL